MEDGKYLQKLVGSHFIMGFRGTSVTSDVRQLIEDCYVGAILLASQNLSSAEQATTLIKDLQQTAFDAGYDQPLLIAIDQENGGVNAIFDKDHIRQFPSALGIVASDSLEMAHSVGSATAKELSCLGVNWLIGPVLDVLANSRTQPLGVRSMGDDPKTVAEFGLEFIKGYQEGGLATCGKHFPSYGNLEFLGTPSEIPIVSETLEQLRLSGLVPFEYAIRGGLDAMLVGACSMPNFASSPITHACLSKPVVKELLREELAFDGVIMSDCLEIEALYENLGVGQATIMGANAGCDMLMICSFLSSQLEAISSLRMSLVHGMLSQESMEKSSARIRKMKDKYTSWDKALNPEGIRGLQRLQQVHEELSSRAYEASISLVRDQATWIPLTGGPGQDLVLLTPLVDPFPTAHGTVPKSLRYLKGEDTFRELGLTIAKDWSGKVRHASYTASGIRPLHEDLISDAAAVVLLTADSGRNAYQYGFTKYVMALCKSTMSPEKPNGKPLIVVAVSSPYDFVRDAQIGTYLCTYDFTIDAFRSLVRVLFGKLVPQGMVVGTRPRTKSLPQPSKLVKPHQKWLVEDFDYVRDIGALQQLLDKVHGFRSGLHDQHDNELPPLYKDASTIIMKSSEIAHCQYVVVRNSSTRALYGFCALYTIKNISRGSIGCLFVDPDRRKLGIGQSLHFRAMKYFLKHELREIQYGSDITASMLGIPVSSKSILMMISNGIKENGYRYDRDQRARVFEIPQLSEWTQPLYSDGPQDILFEILEHNKQSELASTMQFISEWGRRGLRKSSLEHPAVLIKIYARALEDGNGSNVIMMKNSRDNKLTGLALIYGPTSKIADLLPTDAEHTGIISSIIVSPGRSSEYTRVFLSTAISELKALGFSIAQLRTFDDNPHSDVLKELGFELVSEFQSIICSLDSFPSPGMASRSDMVIS